MAAKTHLKTALTICAVLFLLAHLTFAAQPRYEIIDLGTLGGDWSSAYSINDNGQIIGLARNSAYDLCATLFDPTGDGNNIDLGTLGSRRSKAYSINNMGQIVGSEDGLATLFDPAGSGNNVELGVLSGDVHSVAYSINNKGKIVGWSGYFLSRDHATLFDPNGSGKNIELGTLGGNQSSALSINDSGQIVGWAETKCSTYPFCTVHYRATLFDESGNGGNVNLGTLPGGWDHSRAHSINNNGQIVGMAFNGSAYKISAARAALFNIGSSNIDLGTLEGYSSRAHCINDKGQIVGSAGGRAALFDPSGNGNNIDLNILIEPNSGWSLEEAQSINEQGWIVGWGYNKNIGDTHAFLLKPLPPIIIYVDGDATGANDGSSWTDAYNHLQDALTAAWSGDEIRIAQGTYKPDQGAGQTPGDREATFQLINGVTLKGGYAGVGTPDPNARDIELYETILTGDLNGDDVEVNDPCDLLNESTRAENSYHVVTGTGMGTAALLDGFTITGGNANGTDGPPDYLNCGGGIFNGFNYARPTLVNCTFSGNSAAGHGGAILGSYSTIVNCTIKHNSAGIGGGVSCCWWSITDCIIIHNSAYCGGGMGDCECLLTNCTISGNSASSDGGGIWCYERDLTITNCTISGNTAKDKGGGMYFYFYGLTGQTFSNCTIIGNSALEGGGIYGNGSTTVSNCILWGNTAPTGPEIRGISSVAYTDVQDGWMGQGNIDLDPCFVSPGYWDSNGVWFDGDYHLLQSSPCIDAGDPNYIAEPNETDLDGKPRVIGGRIDMGAYESPIFAEAEIEPDTLNLQSKGKLITAFIQLPEEYNVADIYPNSIFLEGEIKPEKFWLTEDNQIAIAKFNREQVQAILEVGDINLKITGQLTDGTPFEATDTIKVIDKAGKK